MKNHDEEFISELLKERRELQDLVLEAYTEGYNKGFSNSRLPILERSESGVGNSQSFRKLTDMIQRRIKRI